MPDPALNFNHNQPVYSVSEVAFSIKRVVEERFGVVRLRGEISGFKQASSGHAYFRLKDDSAVMDAVIWRGSVSKLGFKAEDGLEVVCTGKITTYPGKSSYQIVIDRMEPAGVGALMALLEKRRKQLEEEGLFHPDRKKKLPYLPRVIGVITSPTGAVIRDILHRIGDRWPVHVIVWPVAVQGEGAAQQVAEAIAGFNALHAASGVPVPDLLIVARGGGSIEDLWAFNEEIVVRAVSASVIPLISAVGHETDTTLIDYVSDMRAPTPTAAAELAVPVLEELRLGAKQLDTRLAIAMQRLLTQRREALDGLARGLPKPAQLLQVAAQRLDDWGDRLSAALPAALARRTQQLAVLQAGLRPQLLLSDIRKSDERLQERQIRLRQAMLQLLQVAAQRLADWDDRLKTTLPVTLLRREQELAALMARLRPQLPLADISKTSERLQELHTRLCQAMARQLEKRQERLQHQTSLLESVNYHNVLKRGFALVKDTTGRLVTSTAQAQRQDMLAITFEDGEITVKPVR